MLVVICFLFYLARILRRIGGRIDHVAILHQRIEDEAEYDDTRQHQDRVGPDVLGEGCGNHDTAQTEEHDQVTADDKRMMESQYGALRLGRPPRWRLLVSGHPLDVAPHLEIRAVEHQSDVRGMDKEDGEGPGSQERPDI